MTVAVKIICTDKYLYRYKEIVRARHTEWSQQMIRSLIAVSIVAACCCQVQAERPGNFLSRMNPANLFQRTDDTDSAGPSDMRADQASLREENAAANTDIEPLPPEAQETVTDRNPRRPFWKRPLFRGPNRDQQNDRLVALREKLQERGLDPDRIDARIDRITAARLRRRPDAEDADDNRQPDIQQVRDRIAGRRASMVEKMQENPNVSDTALQRLANLPDVPVARGHETTPRTNPGSPSSSVGRTVGSDVIRDRMQGRGLTSERIEARMARINARGANRR